jgi:DNA polymerase-1
MGDDIVRANINIGETRNYGGTGFTIAKNLGIPEADGDRVYEAYFKAFPDLRKYFDYVQSKTLRQGYILIDDMTNRKSYFKYPQNGKEKHAILKKALNYPIQGLSGSMTKYASILYRRWILANGYENVIFLTNLVHDEINVEAKEEVAEIAAKNLERCMKEAADLWCKIVPMNATAVISQFWGH